MHGLSFELQVFFFELGGMMGGLFGLILGGGERLRRVEGGEDEWDNGSAPLNEVSRWTFCNLTCSEGPNLQAVVRCLRFGIASRILWM